MKILTLVNSEGYKWIDAKVNNYGDINGIPWYNIYRTKGYKTECNKYIHCLNCGEKIKIVGDAEETFEKHCSKKEKNANCVKCSSYYKENKKMVKVVENNNEDGTITERVTNTFYPRCSKMGYYYSTRDNIENMSPRKAKAECKCTFFRCRGNSFSTITPHDDERYSFYGKILTEQSVVSDKVWNLIYSQPSERMYRYKKSSLYAVFNPYGILKYFVVKKKINSNYRSFFVYSSKHKKFARIDSDYKGYSNLRDIPSITYSIDRSKIDEVQEIVISLYK